MRRAARIVQAASDNWPPDLPWPADIPRPAPAPDSPAAVAEAEELEALAADPVGAVKRETELMMDLIKHSGNGFDIAAFAAAEQRKFKAGLMLRDGRIACPNALCLAIGVRRHIYDDVIRRYANGRAGRKRPRKDSETERMLIALEGSGDERFTGTAGRAA